MNRNHNKSKKDNKSKQKLLIIKVEQVNNLLMIKIKYNKWKGMISMMMKLVIIHQVNNKTVNKMKEIIIKSTLIRNF